MTLPKVLVVSEQRLAAVVRRALVHAFSCELTSTVDAGLAAFGRAPFDVVVSDESVDDVQGLDLLETLRARSPSVPFILLGAAGDVQSATEAGRRGAFEYVAKPIDEERLAHSVQRAVALRRQHAPKASEDPTGAGGIIGASPCFLETLEQIERAAQSSAPLLLVGETGTGKDLLAARVHALGPRRHRPFVVVNAAALPAALLDSELFGHVAGSFTGATRARRGLIAEADGGTLFLDEIADLPLDLQGRLLRVIENGRMRPVGADHERAVDVRFVAATHRDLSFAVAEQRFREDLFYRLNVLVVHVPRLRDRTNDVFALFDHFLQRAIAKNPRSPVKEIAPDALHRLLSAPWPGNVRELSAVVERLVVFGRTGRIEVSDLGVAPSAAAADEVPEEILSLRELSERHVEAVLAKVGGDKARAVALLGIDLSTFYRWKRRATQAE